MGGARTRSVVRLGGYVAAYAVAHFLGRATRIEGSQVALLWPAAFVGLLWLLGTRSRRELVASGAALVLTNLVMGVVTETPWELAVPFAFVNLVLGLVTVWALRRGGRPLRLEEPSDLLRLLVGVVSGGLTAGVLAAATFEVVERASFWHWLLLFTTRNSLTMFIGMAVLLAVLHRRGQPETHPGRVEALLAVAVGVGAFVTVFYASEGWALAFLIFPVLVWVAVRFSTLWSCLYTTAAGAFVIAETLGGSGVFGFASPETQALLAQSFAGVTLVVVLALALFRDSRQRLIDALDTASLHARGQAELLGAVLDSISDGVAVVDPHGSITLSNAEARTSPLLPDLLGRLAADPGHEGETPVMVPDGQRTASVSTRPLAGTELSGHRVVAFRDVTSQRLNEQRVRESRDLLAAVLDAASEQLIVGTDLEGRVTVFNEGAERMLGYPREEMLGRTPRSWHLAEELEQRAGELGVPAGFEVLVHSAREGAPETRTWTFVRKDGSRIRVLQSVSPMRSSTGELTGYIGVASDITAQVAAEQASAESAERFRLAFDTAPVGMYLFSVHPRDRGRLTRVNDSLCRLVGRTEHELLGLHAQDLVAENDEESLAAILGQVGVVAGENRRAEVAFRHSDGSVVWGSVSSTMVVPSGGGDAYGICLIEDVTARRQAEAELRHVALHDPLTGAANRVLLVDRLEQALAGAGRTGTLVGLLYLDLDGFKEVNDTWGHAEGDELLKAVAARLAETLRPGDTLSRIGGDEFVLVLPDVHDKTDVEATADRVRRALRAPYEMLSGRVHDDISASLGVAVSDSEASAEGLLRVADQAMYAAKRSGKDRVELVDERGHARAVHLARLVPELRRAIHEKEFVVHGQPIVDLRTGRTRAVETLVRWDHPARGLLPPSEFLDVVETLPDLKGMEHQVLAESLELAQDWGTEGSDIRVHVNVSALQMESGDLRAEVERAIERHDLDPRRLVLEITETHAGVVASSVKRDLARLRENGVLIAIDDIGTGYSSLARLTELPVDILKIDKQFVAGIGHDARCEAIVRSVIGIAAALGLEVVAEGIEEHCQADRLREWGCDLGQGFLFARPEAAPELAETLFASGPLLTMPAQRR